MNGILLACQVENIATRKDKTVKIVLGTQEISPEKAGELFSLSNNLVVAYISQKDVSQDERDMVDQVNPDLPGKSQSQRLRNVLFKLWDQNKEGYSTFDNYYKSKTEAIIEHYKAKIL